MSILSSHLFKSPRKDRTTKSHHVPRRRLYFESAAESRARERL